MVWQASQVLVAATWPDPVDRVSVIVFLVAIVLLPIVGYWLTVLDVRAYLRALRGALIRIGTGGDGMSCRNGSATKRLPACEHWASAGLVRKTISNGPIDGWPRRCTRIVAEMYDVFSNCKYIWNRPIISSASNQDPRGLLVHPRRSDRRSYTSRFPQRPSLAPPFEQCGRRF